MKAPSYSARRYGALACLGLFVAASACAQAITFTQALAPPAPFPLVTGSAFMSETIAPGVAYAQYRLLTSSGPLTINAIAINLRDPSLHVATVLAHDRIASSGETVSAMALRTGAVAGINGDYFARGDTNEPLNIVYNQGMLLRSPGRRVALGIGQDGEITFGAYTFSATASWGSATVPLTGIDTWPPDGGASLILPTYGAPAPARSVAFAQLEPVALTDGGNTYRVVAELEGGAPPAVLGLAMGPAVLATAAPPAVGETVLIRSSIAPALGGMSTVIGGGPMLLSGGQYAAETDLPLNDESASRRYPLSGAARLADGSLLLLQVDGRRPSVSIGLTRPEFAALMRAFGAVDAMCFDSGGSSTIVARLRGEMQAHVRNHPSDGRERPVGDALFVYSAAPAPTLAPWEHHPLPLQPVLTHQTGDHSSMTPLDGPADVPGDAAAPVVTHAQPQPRATQAASEDDLDDPQPAASSSPDLFVPASRATTSEGEDRDP